MAEKTLTIEIFGQDFAELKESEYSLCLAKKVDGYAFNVAWHVYEKFLANNQFTWMPTFELFASSNFAPGQAVTKSVTPVRIELGQQSTLDGNGALSLPKPGDALTALTMINLFGSIHPGINQLSGGLDRGEPTSDPIFLTEKPVLKGSTELTPTEQIMVWFEQDIQTGFMFDRLPPVNSFLIPLAESKPESRTFAIVIDFADTGEQTVSYKDQQWFSGALPLP